MPRAMPVKDDVCRCNHRFALGIKQFAIESEQDDPFVDKMSRFVNGAEIIESVKYGHDLEGAIRAHPHNIANRYIKQF